MTLEGCWWKSRDDLTTSLGQGLTVMVALGRYLALADSGLARPSTRLTIMGGLAVNPGQLRL
jgi:hypothetical protein